MARRRKDVLRRAAVWIAGGCALAGLLLAAGAGLRLGALLFSAAVAMFGAGQLLAGGEDRAVNLVIFLVGIFSMLGVVGHLLNGL